MIKLRLKELMDINGMTIKEVHDKTGISRNTLSNMYNSKTNGIQFDNLDKLVEALNCQVQELVYYTPKAIEFSFKYENGLFYLMYNDGEVNDRGTILFTIDYDWIPVEMWINSIGGPIGNPIEKLALVSKPLVDIFFYEFVDFLLKENKIDPNLNVLFVEHQVEIFTSNGRNTGGHTIVHIENGRVNPGMLKRLALSVEEMAEKKIKIDFTNGVKLTFN